MNHKILVYIPCYNRKRIAELCIPTVEAGLESQDRLSIWNDGSTEYDDHWLKQWADEVRHPRSPNDEKILISVGIEKQRRAHFVNFIHRDEDYTHMYLTDSDAIHDPNWRSKALELQDKYCGVPVCLYDTTAHSNLIGNTLEDDPSSDVIWRRVAPGISYLLTRDHVMKIVESIRDIPDPLHWDWLIPAILGNWFAISRTCYVDHLGYHGLHHPESAGLDGGDIAKTPTQWLVDKRVEFVHKLSSHV
jgi:hypothetical protein